MLAETAIRARMAAEILSGLIAQPSMQPEKHTVPEVQRSLADSAIELANYIVDQLESRTSE